MGHQLLRTVSVALMVGLCLSAVLPHAHALGQPDDGCLCKCDTGPARSAMTTSALDHPCPATWRASAPQVAPSAPLAAAPVIRRGPPVSA